MKKVWLLSVGLSVFAMPVWADQIDWSQPQVLTNDAMIVGTEGTDYSLSGNAVTIAGVSGTGTLTLTNVGLIAQSQTTVTISAPVCIPEGSSVYIFSNRNGAGSDRYFQISGGLSGSGKLYCSSANGYGGVRIVGDCSGFTGEIHVMDVGNNRMKFSAGTDLSGATVYIHGSVADNGAFTDGGIFKIGRLVVDENATPQMKAGSAMTLLIGNLESEDWTLPYVNFNTFGNVKLVNAGAHTMTLAAGYNGKTFGVLGSPHVNTPTGPIKIPAGLRVGEAETSVLTNIVGEGTFVLASKQYRATSSNASTWLSDLNFLVKLCLTNGTTIAQWANGTTGEGSAPNYGITLANDLEISAGYSRLVAWQHNYAVTGNLSGKGVLYLESEKRGISLSGDNHAFSGTCTNHIKGADWVNAGLSGAASGSAAARWVLSGTASVSRGGSERSYYVQGATDADPIHLGALDVPNAATKVQIRQANDNTTTPGAMVIGERTTVGDTDSFFNGTFNKNALHLVKKGAASTLTLGVDASFADGSTIGVTNGTLVVNTTNLANVPVSVAADAAVGGTGRIANLTLAAGAKLADDTALVVDNYVGPTELKPVNSGVVVKDGKKGCYRAVVCPDGGTTRLSCTWHRLGLLIVFQ